MIFTYSFIVYSNYVIKKRGEKQRLIIALSVIEKWTYVVKHVTRTIIKVSFILLEFSYTKPNIYLSLDHNEWWI